MTDLNSVISADSPLSLLIAYNINDRGEIVGDALQKSTGQVHAYSASPKCDDVTCEADSSSVAQVTSDAQKLVLPESVRKLLRRQLRFGRFGAAMAEPQ